MNDQPVSMGRPSKYDPAYCDSIIEHMKDGASVLSFAAQIGVSRATINVWAEAHPEFLEALNAGKAACGAWWEARGREVAQNGGGNGQATMITFGLKNMGRDDWADRQAHEHTGTDGGPIQTASLVMGVTPDKVPQHVLDWVAAQKPGEG